MKERPILFKGEMVRAILDGRKTQTRRIIKPQPADSVGDCIWVPSGWAHWKTHPGGSVGCTCREIKTRFNPGDRLWVRETWGYGSEPVPYSTAHFVYRADGERNVASNFWRPSIHMPRKASRITLEIVDVRVERAQDISDASVLAEGLSPECTSSEIATAENYKLTPLRYKFACLWEGINGRDSWNSNPWVWVIEFKKVLP